MVNFNLLNFFIFIAGTYDAMSARLIEETEFFEIFIDKKKIYDIVLYKYIIVLMYTIIRLGYIYIKFMKGGFGNESIFFR